MTEPADSRATTPAETSRAAPDEDAPESPTPESRRRMLQLLGGGLAVSLAGCSGSGSQISKSRASYQDHPRQGAQCSGCRFYRSPTDGGNRGGCTKVKGKIDPDGWCRLFSPG